MPFLFVLAMQLIMPAFTAIFMKSYKGTVIENHA